MKNIGVLLVCFSLGMRFQEYLSVNQFQFDFELVLSFIGIIMILIDEFTVGTGIPEMENPPTPPKKCICNDIGKHSPGGRCEACHSKKFNSKGIEIPQFPKDRVGCCV